MAIGLAIAVVLALVAAGCAGGAAGSLTPVRTELTVFAAASLRSVFEALAGAYRGAAPAIDLVASTGSSAALATQIEQGGPAELFLSADLENPARLQAAGLADGPVVPFATNALAIVVTAGNPARIASPVDLARPGLRIVAAGAAVPVTRYADQLVANLAAQPDYPPGFAAAYLANVVSREDDAGAVVAKVLLGEADAAIAYATDAIAAGLVTVPIPDAANVAVTYGAVVVRDPAAPDDGSSAGTTAARAFLAWITGPEGQAILARYGFGTP